MTLALGYPAHLTPCLPRSTYTGPIPRHPAKWSGAVLDVIAPIIHGRAAARIGTLFAGSPYRVLDPCAGIGGIHALAADAPAPIETWTVELQPEWAAAHRDDPALDARSLVGDATALPDEWTGAFDAVVTSLVYPNRMTDSHEARDACGTCGGSGCTVENCLGAHPDDGEDHRLCPTCRGRGLSRRNTYRHALDEVDAPVAPGSQAVLGWGDAYRRLAAAIVDECARVLAPYGLLLLNMSNHIADGREVPVVEWYLQHLLAPADRVAPDWRLERLIPVATPRLRHGANGSARVDHEFVLALTRSY